MAEAADGIENLTRADVVNAMASSAIDIEQQGFDRNSGAGIVMAPAAVVAVSTSAVSEHPPEVSIDLPYMEFSSGDSTLSIDLGSAFFDPDGDELTFEYEIHSQLNPSFNSSTKVVTLTPSVAGEYSISVIARDPRGLTAAQGFSVMVSMGEQDYDIDDDGLIEANSLAQLWAIREDLDGNGHIEREASRPYYADAFPDHQVGMGCPPSGCFGYELTADLDFDTNGDGSIGAGDDYWGEPWGRYVSGEGWLPIGSYLADIAYQYNAIFDGNGHTISNLWMKVTTHGYAANVLFGLFGVVGPNGEIRNVGLENVDIRVATSISDSSNRPNAYGTQYVGGLVGFLYGGEISSSFVTGHVESTDDMRKTYDANKTWTKRRFRVGGLVAYSRGLIQQSHASIKVVRNTQRNLAGEIAAVGGLVGTLSLSATVRDTHFTGSVVWQDSSTTNQNVGEEASVGALVGSSSESTIVNNYAVAIVEGEDSPGLVGDSDLNSHVSQSYLDLSVAGIVDSSDIAQSSSSLRTNNNSASDSIFSEWSSSRWGIRDLQPVSRSEGGFRWER